jgi:signal transduction histidine kinase
MSFPFSAFFRPARSAWGNAPRFVFTGIVVLVYATCFWEHTLPFPGARGAACLGAGLAFALLGLADLGAVCQEAGLAGKLAYVAIQTALLAVMLWTSRLSGELDICIYPLVGVMVAILPAIWGAAGVTFIYALTVGMEGHFYGTHAAQHWAIGMLPAFGFDIMFTLLAIKANAARVRAEELSAEVERLAVVQERNRLAREIHDSLGHYLTTIHAQLQGAEAVHGSDPGRALKALGQARELARDALVEVRHSVEALKAEPAQQPLDTRLRILAAAAEGWGVVVTVTVLGPPRALPPDAEHALYRSAQEGLTNVRKHAQARRAAVELDYRDGACVRVGIVDDGCGAAATDAGHGLRGVRERIEALGGRVSAASPAEGGFRLQVEIPA